MPPPPQRFSDSSPVPVNAGDTLNVVYVNSDLAGTDVTISITNGEGGGGDHVISLDANGRGTIDFTVPADGWHNVFLNGPDSAERTVPVTH